MPSNITVPDDLQARIDTFYISTSELTEKGIADADAWVDNGAEARELLDALMTLAKSAVVPDSLD